jgi:hypothetical protein
MSAVTARLYLALCHQRAQNSGDWWMLPLGRTITGSIADASADLPIALVWNHETAIPVVPFQDHAQ